MKALVLAGGVPQISLIKELKKRGIYTILADYNQNPVAKEFADCFYQVSTLDVKGITDIACKEMVDFIITVCTDQALLTMAYVSEILGLPCYIDYNTALNVTNKSYMKKVLIDNGISTSKYVALNSFEKDDEVHYYECSNQGYIEQTHSSIINSLVMVYFLKKTKKN